MKRTTKWLCLLLFALGLTGCSSPEAAETTLESTDLFAMDTYMNLKVYSVNGHTPITEASERITALENTFSVTNPDSDVSRINTNGSAEVSDDTKTVIEAGLSTGIESGGALDITIYPLLRAWGFTTDTQQVPDAKTINALLENVDASRVNVEGNTVSLPDGMMLDLGALAKGYTSDEVIRIFKENGAESGIISLGGNVQALGRKPDGSLWSVGVVNPFSPAENLCVLRIENQAVITSGNYERYFVADDGEMYWHILDKSDGYPADNGLVSVTVVGDSGLRCDALSTALFVEGEEQAPEHWRRCDDFEMICVTADGRILLSEGLEDSFENTSGLPVEVMHRE
ncbi:MAG: FAD:protein FMN transferase [Oscillospiraceae bacterium]|nr:FAD:protein FMN transferase [Oscillospiraceae bacterium]